MRIVSRRKGCQKKCTFCTLMKMTITLDDPNMKVIINQMVFFHMFSNLNKRDKDGRNLLFLEGVKF